MNLFFYDKDSWNDMEDYVLMYDGRPGKRGFKFYIKMDTRLFLLNSDEIVEESEIGDYKLDAIKYITTPPDMQDVLNNTKKWSDYVVIKTKNLNQIFLPYKNINWFNKIFYKDKLVFENSHGESTKFFTEYSNQIKNILFELGKNLLEKYNIDLMRDESIQVKEICEFENWLNAAFKEKIVIPYNKKIKREAAKQRKQQKINAATKAELEQEHQNNKLQTEHNLYGIDRE